MKLIVNKKRSVGLSTVAPFQSALKIGHFLLDAPGLARSPLWQGNFTVLVGEVAFIKYLGVPAVDKDEARNVVIPYKRLSDVIDLDSKVFAVGVRQEDCGLGKQWIWGDVHELAVGGLPHRVELRLDKNSRPLPDCPAKLLNTTIGSNVLWNDAKAFFQWLADQRAARHLNWFAAWNDLQAERHNVGLDGGRDAVHLVLTPNV